MRRVITLLAGVAIAFGGVVAAAGPAGAGEAHESNSPYVAMGDSYSSAAGVNPLVPTAPATCSRSQLNFAHDIAAALHPASFTDVTCSGAKTADFFGSQAQGVPPQLSALTKSTRLVTMTIGGNDENVFVDSFFGCVTISLQSGSPFGNPCQQKYGSTFTDLIKTQTYAHLVRTLRAVRAKAPHAEVFILGYPRILPDQGVLACYPSMPVSMGDVPWLVDEQKTLNAVVRRAASVTGVRFVDTFSSSAGHDACQAPGTRWIEPATNPINAFPVHPNATGEAAMARDLLRQDPD